MGITALAMADFKYHQYHVVGRHLPTESDPSPSLFRMKVWAVDEVCARSKFWYFIKRIKRVKKANGQIIAVNEIFEKDPTTVKNYGVWLRVMTMNGAIDQMYQDLAARHRIRASCIQIIKTGVLADEECKRPNITQFHKENLSFPLPIKTKRASEKKYRSTLKANRPNVAHF